MWWTFVGRDHDEIVEARAAWADGSRFGEVRGYDGDPIPAPPMPITRLVPRGRVRWSPRSSPVAQSPLDAAARRADGRSNTFYAGLRSAW